MESTAHALVEPVEMELSDLPLKTPEVLTATGTRLRVVELLPSSPSLLKPQQYVWLSEAMAQVKSRPDEIDLIVLPLRTPEVLTATGTLLSFVELFPSDPLPSLPQQ